MKKRNFITIGIAAVIAVAMILVTWNIIVPGWTRDGALEDARLKSYIVTQMPELEGADIADISLGFNGVYHADYHGQSYQIKDPAIQNNIAAFAKSYMDCYNYQVGATKGGIYITIATCASFVVATLASFLWIIDDIKELRKAKKKAQQSCEVTA